MARNRLQRAWLRLDNLVRNAIDIRTWSGANSFLRRGTTSLSTSQDFGAVEMQPREYYVGQLGGAIRTRANRVAALAKEHVKTRLFDDPEQELDPQKVQHPYLKLINESPSFSNTFFWKALSTFLDLTGTAYVFVLRNYTKNGKVTGVAKEFKIVNPFNLTKVVNGSDPSQYRYIETRGAAWREIPEKQLIVIRSLNPFNLDDGYPLVEMAKDDQFSIQQARSYTRGSIKNNVGQRGMLAPEQVLGEEDFANFEKAVAGKGTDGKFLTTNAPVKYTDMQIDLDKLALDKINTISTDVLIAVTGASRTILGIEKSDVSQEAAKVQRDLFTENHGIPQLDDILDPLNQDYKNNYKSEYEAQRLEMFVDSPLRVDKDRELKDAQIGKAKAETAKILIDTGYEAESVGKFLDLDDELVFEERQPKGLPIPGGTLQPDEDMPEEMPEEMRELKQALNRFSPGLETVVRGYETTLENQVTNIEGQVLQAVLPKLTDKFAKNQLTDEEAQTIPAADRKRIERDLELALAAFGLGIVTLFAGQTMTRRFAEFGLPAEFTVTSEVSGVIKSGAKLSANSHMDTFISTVFSEARKAGLEGLSRDGIVGRLTAQFPALARTNARRVARTESYKAVNLSQYEADKQFLEQNGLESKAYKQWVTQSSNPCPYCIEMAKRPAVPFSDNFLDLGDSVKAEFDNHGSTTTREQHVTFEPITSGTLHPNCSCSYELVIRRG